MTVSNRLDALYRSCSARLAAHAAERLAAGGQDPIGQTDDITQDVWVWAAQQSRLPSWEGLRVMTDWVIEGLLADQAERPELPAGLRPQGKPVIPLDPRLQAVDATPSENHRSFMPHLTAA